MAKPQVEHGHLAIADDLVTAFCREELSSVELKLLLAIMNMTYRVGKTKSEIGYDDLSIAIAQKRYKVVAAIEALEKRKIIFVQATTNGGMVIGLQKDYEEWLPKMGKSINSGLEEYKYISTRRDLPKMGKTGQKDTPQGRYLRWVLDDMHLELTLGAWRKEYSRAKKLYESALTLAHEPKTALYALKDYYTDTADPAFKAKVKYPIAYLSPGFERWYKARPKKPYSVKQDEEITGKRHRYDLKTKRWIPTGDRL